MSRFDRITVDPEMMNDQAYIRHMRLTVRRVVELVATYADREELYREYPELEEEDVRQARAYGTTHDSSITRQIDVSPVKW